MDNKLKCDAKTCAHNFNELCDASVIHVNGGNTHSGDNTFCDTYAVRSVGNYAAGLNNVNVAGSFAQAFTNKLVMDPKVYCTAMNCVYNENQVCDAAMLKIVGPDSTIPEQTECNTFYPQ
jgi:hypothetical protein